MGLVWWDYPFKSTISKEFVTIFQVFKKVNFDGLLLNDKGFIQQKSNLIIGERLKVNRNLFNMNSLDSLNGNYAIKFMTKDSILMSSGSVIKIIDKNVAGKELVHIEILLLKSKL